MPLNTKDITPPPFKALLVPQVILPVTIYALQAFIDMSSQFLLPLVYSTSIPIGGLGLDAYDIGIILSAWGVFNAAVLLTLLGPAIRRFGPRAVHIFSYGTYFVNIGSYPLLSYFARRAGGVDGYVWAVIVLQLVCRFVNGMSYGLSFSAPLQIMFRADRRDCVGSIQIIIADSAPSRAALGATTGLAQALGSVGRAMGPTVASSLFSVSLEWQIMGGNMVYVVLSGLALVGMRLAFLLPKEVR